MKKKYIYTYINCLYGFGSGNFLELLFLWESTNETVEEKSVTVILVQNTVVAIIVLESRLVTKCSLMLDVIHDKWMEKAGITGEQ